MAMTPPDSSPRLLVVDDEPAICELIANVARGVGFEVETASDAAQIDAALGGGHDVTVLDLQLNGDDGVSAMRTLSARAPGAAIIVASGAAERVLGSAQRVAAMYGLRVIGVCPKPLAVSSLQHLLHEARGAVAHLEEPRLTEAEVVERVTSLRIEDIHIAYQPVIDLATGAVVSVEAFSRWDHGDGTPMGPAEFIPELERNGVTGELLAHVAACVAADRASDELLAGLPTVAINVSVRDLERLDLPEMLHDILTPSAPAHRWVIEVTETATTVAPRQALDVITRLSLMEFRLAIDDFGTGSSNLERLRWYPFSELKVDQSFINDAEGSGSGWIIVTNAVAMAQQLGLEVVAEGVEDTRMLRRLREIGCDQAQGFLISRPAGLAELGARCEAWQATAASLF